MGKYKTLAGNTLIFGICNFTSKLLVFFMMPFYTSILSTEEFGTADLITTTVSLMIPILTLCVSEGCMRFAIEHKLTWHSLFSFGIKVILIGGFVLVLSTPFLEKISFFRGYVWLLVLMYISNVLQNFLSLFSRGIDKVKIVGIAGIVSAFIVVISNILLLSYLKLGIQGYIVSIIISQLVASSILFWGAKMYKYIKSEREKGVAKEVLSYSLPLMPNSIGWWVNHSANRYLLGVFGNISDVGLYSAASRMPSIVDTFRGVFIQAWQLSAINEYDKNAQSFFSTIYRGYNVFIITVCSLLIVFSKSLSHILYSGDFFGAWVITPLLIVSVLFSSLIAFYSPIYLATKKTAKLLLSTLLGAIITIISNIILIPIIGIKGTAFSAIISYFSIFLYLHLDSKKYIVFEGSTSKYFVSYIIVLVQALLITYEVIVPLGAFSLLLFLTLLIINARDFSYLLSSLYRAILKK